MMMPPEQNPLSRRAAAFTLVELLVVIAIIALLASLVFAGVRTAEQSAHRAAAVANLRQIGAAISMYSNDHDQNLPGPLYPGQLATYLEAKPERLTVKLAKYLSTEEVDGAVVGVFVPPAFKRSDASELVEDQEDGARTLVVNMKVLKDGVIENPWGMAGQDPPQQPRKMIDLMDPDTEAPIKTWALSDADQQHPDVATAPWSAKTPSQPIHGTRRATLFFDWHAELKDLDYFSAPATQP